MAGLGKSVFRFYARTRSDIYEILPYAYAYACPHRDHKEIQIVLAFARDYDKEGNHRNGEFFPYFDTIAPQDIQTIKEGAPTPCSIKFFLSIGGRDPRFPFAVNSDVQRRTWIDNATESLQRIIHEYHIDGIDVYYEHINDDAQRYFAKSIVTVIRNIKKAISIQASITVSDPLIDIYVELYERCPDDDFIDIVVYQCFTLPAPPDDLVAVFVNKLFPHYPKGKILAGYSDWPCDKRNVDPATFVDALAQLLSDGILGFSMWHGNPEP